MLLLNQKTLHGISVEDFTMNGNVGDANSLSSRNGNTVDLAYNISIDGPGDNGSPSPPQAGGNAPHTTAGVHVNDLSSELDVVLNNVVCTFSVRCHLNLRQIALNGFNVEYKRENGLVSFKLRRPGVTASIWSSGKITCTGATSEADAKTGARRVARLLQKLGFKTKFHNFRIVNVLGTCTMPFAIKITLFSEKHKEAEYEPELHPGVTYKNKQLKATLKIYSTGSITVTAPSVLNVQRAIEFIFPLVHEFRKEHTEQEKHDFLQKKRRLQFTTKSGDNGGVSKANADFAGECRSAS